MKHSAILKSLVVPFVLTLIGSGAEAVLPASTDSTARAAQPTVTRIEPLGVVRGQTTVVVLHGDRLADAHKVLFDQPGLSVTEVKAVDAKKVEVTVVADETVAPGLYPLQLVTKSGISNLRLIGVGAMPVVQEVEPNSDFDTAQKIELNCTLEGVIKLEDVDYFEVELTEGQTINIEVEGLRLSYDYSNRIFDPHIAVLDERQVEVAQSDDSPLLLQDPLCTFTAPKSGTYKIMLRDSSFGGSDLALYRMHVGTFPRPISVVPAGGKPGDMLTATLVHPTGDPESPLVTTAQVQLPSERTDLFPVVTQNEHGISPSPNWIRVNDLPVTVEAEPNDDIRKGNAASMPGALCGAISYPGDIDCFSFACSKSTKYLVRVFARGTLRSPLDSVISVYDPSFKSVANNDDEGRNPDSFVEFTAAEDGQYTVRITDSLRRGGPEFAYRIEVTTADPKLTLDRREIQRDEPYGVSIPRGGAMAMMITAKRENFGGDLNLEFADLPEGVQFKTYPMPANRAEIPVILTAAADAPASAALVAVKAKVADEKLAALEGSLKLRHKLVLGQNRVDMWGYDSQRLAVAVAEPAPFKIRLEQPGTPVVRSGSKDLKVVIERNEGFEGEVALATLYSPPGVAVNNGLKIAKDANEVKIPITANGGAQIGNWPMLMVATYDTGNGRAEIVTDPIDLEIQDVAFKFEFPRIAGEVGGKSALKVDVEVVRPFEGTAEVELVGLPPGVTSPAAKQPITPESTSVTFPIELAADAKVGNHKTLYCVAKITNSAGEIVQTQGTGELRVDEPLAPKPDAAAPPAEAAKPEEPKAEPKPLSRLEQLREMKKGSK
jgi:hypothetical protein